MTVHDLIEKLKEFPLEATVFTSQDDGDEIRQVVDVQWSEDDPLNEVYVEVTF
jgi:hypothetical protein